MDKSTNEEDLVSTFTNRYKELDRQCKAQEEELNNELYGMMLMVLQTQSNYKKEENMALMLRIVDSIDSLLDFSEIEMEKRCRCLGRLFNEQKHCFSTLSSEMQLLLVELSTLPSDFKTREKSILN